MPFNPNLQIEPPKPPEKPPTPPPRDWLAWIITLSALGYLLFRLTEKGLAQ